MDSSLSNNNNNNNNSNNTNNTNNNKYNPPKVVASLANSKSPVLQQEWLVWCKRPSTTTNSGSYWWWPAIQFPSIAAAHAALIRGMSHDPKAVKAWTLAHLQEFLSKQQRPVLGLLLNEFDVELSVLDTSDHNSSSSNNNNAINDHGMELETDFVGEFSSKLVETGMALPEEQREGDWTSALKRVQSILMQSSSPQHRPSSVIYSQTKQDNPKRTCTFSENNQALASPRNPSHPLPPRVSMDAAAAAALKLTGGESLAEKATTLGISPRTSPRELAAAVGPAVPTSSPFYQQHHKGLFPNTIQKPRRAAAAQQAASEEIAGNSMGGHRHHCDGQFKDASDSSNACIEAVDPNKDADWVPPLDADLQVDWPWLKVWQTLEFSGWTKRLAPSSVTGAVKEWYVKPNVSTDDSRPGIGYFTNIDDLQDFCREFYPWKGPSESLMSTAPEATLEDNRDEDSLELESSSDEDQHDDDDDDDEDLEQGMGEDNKVEEVVKHPSNETVVSCLTNPTACHHWEELPTSMAATPNQPTHPQDPAKPLLSSGRGDHHSTISDHSFASSDDLTFYLRQRGWTIKPGKGLVSWVYVKPGKTNNLSKGAVENVDFFNSEDAVLKYINSDKAPTSKPQKDGGKKQKTDRKKRDRSIDPDNRGDGKHNANKKKQKGQDNDGVAVAKQMGQDTKKQSTKGPTNGNTEHSKMQLLKSGAGKARRPNQKYLRVAQAKKLLRAIGFEECGEQWILTLSRNETLSFVSLTGLRKFLCNQGLPEKYKTALGRLPDVKQKDLIRWICFANVPLSAKETEFVLKNEYREPQTSLELRRLLSERNRIETYNDRYYMPDQQSREHVEGVNYFKTSDGPTHFRRALRGVSHWVKEDLRGSQKKYRIQLLLWAALCDQPLPDFDEAKAKEVHQERYANVPEEPQNQEGSDADEESTAASSGKQGTLSTSAESLVTRESLASTSKRSASTAQKSKGSSKKARKAKWYDEGRRPALAQVWPVLTKLGFVRTPNKPGLITHASYPNDMVGLTEKQLCVGIAFCGIPTYTPKNDLYPPKRSRGRGKAERNIERCAPVTLGKEERELLLRWAGFAHFPCEIDDSTRAILDQLDSSEKLPKIVTSQKMTVLGFHRNGEILYPPNADWHMRAKRNETARQAEAQRVRGLHELPGRKETIEFLRSAPCIDLMQTEEESDKKKEAALFLRLWAMREATKLDLDLPRFCPTSARWQFLMEWCKQKDSAANSALTQKASNEIIHL